MNVQLPEGYEHLCSFSIPGNLPRKSNQRRIAINKKTQKLFVIKSEKALKYSDIFEQHISDEIKSQYSGNLLLVANIYYASRRSDLSDELLCDLLQKYGVVKNDRDIVEKVLFGFVDKENPRVEGQLFKISVSRTPILLGESNNGHMVFG